MVCLGVWVFFTLIAPIGLKSVEAQSPWSPHCVEIPNTRYNIWAAQALVERANAMLPPTCTGSNYKRCQEVVKRLEEAENHIISIWKFAAEVSPQVRCHIDSLVEIAQDLVKIGNQLHYMRYQGSLSYNNTLNDMRSWLNAPLSSSPVYQSAFGESCYFHKYVGRPDWVVLRKRGPSAILKEASQLLPSNCEGVNYATCQQVDRLLDEADNFLTELLEFAIEPFEKQGCLKCELRHLIEPAQILADLGNALSERGYYYSAYSHANTLDNYSSWFHKPQCPRPPQPQPQPQPLPPNPMCWQLVRTEIPGPTIKRTPSGAGQFAISSYNASTSNLTFKYEYEVNQKITGSWSFVYVFDALPQQLCEGEAFDISVRGKAMGQGKVGLGVGLQFAVTMSAALPLTGNPHSPPYVINQFKHQISSTLSFTVRQGLPNQFSIQFSGMSPHQYVKWIYKKKP